MRLKVEVNIEECFASFKSNMASGSDAGVPHENSRFVPQYPRGDEQEVNGRSEGSASTSSSSRRSRTPRNVLLDRESKSNNITKMPDRNQVVSRLNQIRDYIKQTSSLMDTLKNSGDPRHLAQYHKLLKMVSDLKESEGRLMSFLPELENNDQDSNAEKFSVESMSEAGNSLPEHPCGNVNSHPSSVMLGGNRDVAVSLPNDRSQSEELNGAVLKSSDSARRNELKMKVEESQRRLQALQEHQAALLALQQKAQVQLREARAAQGVFMARAVGIESSGPPLASFNPVVDEHSVGCTDGNSNSQGSGTQQSVNGSHGLQGNMEHIADRLQTLHELYENRNQLVQMLGERDEDLVSEHMVLQDKLQELQYKKQHMDHLVAEFQALNNLPGVNGESQVDIGSSKDESEDGDAQCSDGEPDYEVVRDKIAELNMMKAQLAQLKGIMAAVQNRENINDSNSQNGNVEGPVMRDVEDLEHEEQAVNLRRQKRDKSKGASSKVVPHCSTNVDAAGSSKRDNIVQASSEVERSRDIHQKTIQLQEAKARLHHLQDLLTAVTEFHNRGQPVPEQYIDLLSTEAAREEGAGDAGRSEIPTSSVSRSQRSSTERERTPMRQQIQEGGLPDGCEVTLEVVQAMTRDLRQQTLSLQEERERLVSARRELGKLQRELPLREKKTNTQVDTQTHQHMLLHAELQAKRRELEELMRKDQGQTSAINQDVCSEISADKSETPVYSFLGEGTTNATWGGSTQGTLDDLAEQDNDIREQSAGYSSDEGQEDDVEEDPAFPAGPSQLRLAQLNNSNNNSNKDPLTQSVATTRDLLSMSLDSGRVSLSGNINNTNHSNSTSIAGSSGHAPSAVGSGRTQRQGSTTQNIWRKESSDSGTSIPRAVWTPSQQARQENLCTAEELVSSNNLETNNVSSSATLHNSGLHNSNQSTSFWQQQAVQLQHQLEVTSNLCQSMLLDQVQQQQQQQHQQHGNNLLAAIGAGSNNMLPNWGFPPPPYPLAPHQSHSIAPGGLGGPLLPANVGSTPDMYYQQLYAASQLQQQQLLLTTVNQCCHLLWLQQREIMALRSSMHALQDKTTYGNGSRGGENYSPPIVMGQPEETVLITSNQNSAHPTPHQSQSNLSRLQHATTNPTTFSPHQNLKLSYSGGLFQSPEELTGSSGVTSAHSLPNLSQTTSANSVFSHQADALPSVAPLNNDTPNFNPTTTLASAQNFQNGTLTLSFPMNNNVNFNNRSQQQPISSLIQCSASQPGSGTHWLQQGTPGATSGLLQGHTTPSPVPALNNQVPPGNRANNYWDNFRSYSRQNLLSTSTKSNEGVSHSPSPLVDRSHNTLRGSVSQSSSLPTPEPQPSTSVLSQTIGPVYTGPELNVPVCNMSRKEKLNTEQYQNSPDNLSLPPSAHSNMSDTPGLHYQILGTSISSISHPRSRNHHNCGDNQLQTNVSRPRLTGSSERQTLLSGRDLHDLQLHTNVSGLRGIVGCISSSEGQILSEQQHNFSSVPEFHIEPEIRMEARNISLAEQDVQSHQNYAITSESLSTYQSNCGSKDDEEPSEFMHVKTQGITISGVNKRKNPKTTLSANSQLQQNSSVNTSADQKTHQAANTLFEALSESVYSEVAALISANESRPHFLIQLFRDLQMISSDPLRQKTLQSIHEVVSRYLASETAVNQPRESQIKPQVNNEQSIQNENSTVVCEHDINGSTVASDEENVKEEENHYHLTESLKSSLVELNNDTHCLPNISGRCETNSGPHSIAGSEEGAAALLPSSHSSPRALPRNAAWSIKDGLSLPVELPGRSSKLDWEVQAVLVDLLPFLKAHLDDTCSSSLLEAVRRLTLQLVPAQNLSHSPAQHSSQHSRLGCCYQGQLDALLEDALLKFQGCRLRDVSEELLTVVAEVLLSELTFLRLVDTVSRGDTNNEGSDDCCKNPTAEEHSRSGGAILQPSESTQHFLSSEIGSHVYHDSHETILETKAYNGDLAEADQSHHEESVGDIPELEAESAAALNAVEEVSIERQSHHIEATVNSDSCIIDNTAVEAQNNLLQDEMITVNEGTNDFNRTEMEEEWEVEQDREQGLDRVPTRLSTDQQTVALPSGSSSPERDCHNLVPHPANQPDAPSP